jgi:hypothetical protein
MDAAARNGITGRFVWILCDAWSTASSHRGVDIVFRRPVTGDGETLRVTVTNLTFFLFLFCVVSILLIDSHQKQLCFFIKWRVFIVENMHLTPSKYGPDTTISFKMLMEKVHFKDQETCRRILTEDYYLPHCMQYRFLKCHWRVWPLSGPFSTGFLCFHANAEIVPFCHCMLLMHPFQFLFITSNCLSVKTIKLLDSSCYLAFFTMGKCTYMEFTTVCDLIWPPK